MATDFEKHAHDAAVQASPSPERGQRKVRWHRSTFYNAVILGVCKCGDAVDTLIISYERAKATSAPQAYGAL